MLMCVSTVQVQIYRALAAVFKQVVDDIETDFKPHHKAQTWQENLQHRIYDFLNSDDAKKPEAVTERASPRENGRSETDYFYFPLKPLYISSCRRSPRSTTAPSTSSGPATPEAKTVEISRSRRLSSQLSV